MEKLSFEQIQELITAMVEAGLSRVELKVADAELVLEKGGGGAIFPTEVPVHVSPPAPGKPEAPPAPTTPQEQPKEGVFITSPMVGTFYSAPSPEAEVFVKVGDRVDDNTVVCIVEAMKVMNEIKAGVKGILKEILIESGHPVEFGSKLFRVEDA